MLQFDFFFLLDTVFKLSSFKVGRGKGGGGGGGGGAQNLLFGLQIERRGFSVILDVHAK